MALSLGDFQAPRLTMEDFEGQLSYGKTPNERSAKMVAASQAGATGAQRESYEQTKNRLLDPTQQDKFTLEHQQTRDAMWEQFIEPGVSDIIADPTMDLQTKDSLVESTFSTSRNPLSTTSMLALQAARADMEEDATEAAEESRYKFIDSIKRVEEEKRKRQTAINSLNLGKDQGVVDTIVDLGEVIAPFAEWINVDNMQKALGDPSSALTSSEGFLLGEQKRNLYESIRKMPMDKRQEFTEVVLDMVQNNKQVILPDGNDMVALETLNRMLIDNDYSDFERWFDNATSVLDIAGVGGLVRSVKAGKAAKVGKAAKATGGIDGEILKAERAAEEVNPNMLGKGEVIEGTYTDVTTPMQNTPLIKVSIPDSDEAIDALATATHTEVAPVAPSQVVKDVNPTVARDMHNAAMADGTGESAEALYGTTRTEAAAKDILPEPDITPGRMPNKVDMKPSYEEPENLKRARTTDGRTYVAPTEMEAQRARLTHSFEDVEGMKLHKESLIVRTNQDATIGVTARYSPRDSGFRTWGEAVSNAKFAFRRYGLNEENFTPLVRNGDEWVEATPKQIEAKAALKAAGAKGKEFEDIDFAVGIKYDYAFRPEDLQVDELLNTSTGVLARSVQFADRLTGDWLAKKGQGSFVQNFLDPASVIPAQIVEPAHIAVDRAVGLKKLYQEQFEVFGKAYGKLPKDRRAMMNDYIVEANLDGLPLSVSDLYGRGFTGKEIEMLQQWRRSNDAMWYAANEDMVKSLRAKGFVAFTHEASDTKLIGKPLKRMAVSENTTVFDPVKGVNTRLTKQEMDELYEKGGEIVRLDEQIQIDGEWVGDAVSRNTPSGGYTRAIYDGEVVMPYRDGYYPVMYDANYFIEKHIKLKDGTVKKKVVASARDSKEVDEALKMLRSSEPDAIYESRHDRRIGRDEIFGEGSWSNITNAGLSSQRVRGERLGDAGANLQNIGQGHLKDPLEAVANQIYQLSQRVAMRDYMATVRNRWMQNYFKHFNLPENKFGQIEFPKSVSELVPKPNTPAKVVADGKNQYNYLYSLENGYINGMDELFRGVLHHAADIMGEIGWSKAQRALFEGAKGSPIRAAKTAAFKMFLSMHPLRQAVIQRGQMLQLGAVNPKYAGSTMVSDLVNIRLVRSGLNKDPKFLSLYDEIKDAGVLEAVDAHVLIREDAMRLTDMTWMQKTSTTLNKPIDLMQRYGFDAAEQDVLLSAWLSFRDLAVKAGKDIKDQRVKDEILGQARAFTGGMNRAGDMAYGGNTFSLFTQFLSFRHKMLLQTISNKSLTPMKRAQLLAFNVAMFGPDATLVSYLVDSLFEGKPSPERDMIEDGLLSVFLNESLSLISGKDQAIDWGDFAPAEAYGMGDVLVGMMTTNLLEMAAKSPSGSLLFGANPRLADAFKTAGRYFNVLEDYEDPELSTKLSDVVIASANLFSGYSAAFKARYAYQTGKKMSTTGSVTDEDITGVESYLAGLGFQTKTEQGYRKTYEVIYGKDYVTKGGMEQDVKDWYKELKRQLARRGTTTQEDDMSMRVLSEAWRVFGEERPAAVDIILGEIQKDARDKDYAMIQNLIGRMGLTTKEEMWTIIRELPAGNIRDQLQIIMEAKDNTSGN